MLVVPPNLGEYDEAEYPYTPVKGWKSAPDPDDVKAAVKALLQAENPLLHVGEGVFYGQATDELLQFAELAQVPVDHPEGQERSRRTTPRRGRPGSLAGTFSPQVRLCCSPSVPASSPTGSATLSLMPSIQDHRAVYG